MLLLADSGFLLLIGGLFITGLIGFVLAAVFGVLRVAAWTLKALTGLGERPTPSRGRTSWGQRCMPRRSRSAGGQRSCPHPGCGRMNRSGANFCGACGRALSGAHLSNTYG